jgi:hypothetical protein
VIVTMAQNKRLQQQALERIGPFAITYAFVSLPRILRLLTVKSKASLA